MASYLICTRWEDILARCDLPFEVGVHYFTNELLFVVLSNVCKGLKWRGICTHLRVGLGI